MAEDVRAFLIGGDWKDAELERGVKYNTVVIDGGRRFMAEWRKKEKKKATRIRKREREAKETGKVVVVPGVAVEQLRRFRAALLGSSRELLK